MAKVKIITAYVPLKDHPRTPEEYGALGENFRGVTAAPVKAFYMNIVDMWLARFAWEQTNKVTHSEGDNPKKNTLNYHCVQHQKFSWLGAASLADPEPDVFVWMDYGIFHQPGVTATVINDFVKRVDDKAVYVPGCWPNLPVDDKMPNWRWVGSMISVPRRFLRELDNRFREETRRQIWKTNNVTWEVNDFARMEQNYKLPFLHWYGADHNETQFTNWSTQ